MTAETEDILTVRSLKAYYRMAYFGVDREVRAVDDITLSVRKNEIYGIAGESSSGKTTLIKTFAAAIRPPLRIVGGSMTYHFQNGDIDPYAATKGAVKMFTQGLARELGARGITVNNVQPGPIDTDLNPASGEWAGSQTTAVPLGRYGRADEVAALVAFLASEHAGYINGASIDINGGALLL